MKFLVVAKLARHGLPLKRVLPILKASKKWHEEKLKSGMVDCIYNVIEGGGIAIQNHNSAEEVFDALADYPGYLLYDWEVRPLVDNSRIMDRAIERVEKALAVQKKMGT